MLCSHVHFPYICSTYLVPGAIVQYTRQRLLTQIKELDFKFYKKLVNSNKVLWIRMKLMKQNTIAFLVFHLILGYWTLAFRV